MNWKIAGLLMGAAGAVYLLSRSKRNKMKLSPNFSVWEFASKDGAAFPLDVLKNLQKLAQNLEVIRAEVNRPILITSGYRSLAHNAKVGGAKNSLHTLGKAADFKVQGISPIELGSIIEQLIAAGKIEQGGLGIYPTWVHYDNRGTKARW